VKPRALTGTVVLATTLALPQAWAGRACDDPKPLTPQTLERAMTLALRTSQALDASGADIVLLARAGQDLSKYKVHYSHLGFAYREVLADGTSVWRVLHKLNQCGTAESAIYKQGLGEFYLDDLWRYEAAWITPNSEVQKALLPVLRDTPQAVRLHVKAYNMLSYPWATRYQQSNQWAMETVAMALAPVAGEGAPAREKAQAWLRLRDYQPSVLQLDAITRLGARMTRANVAFDDHPDDKRYSGHIETVTVDSVFDWMQRAQLSTGKVSTVE
jgi:hypothetical protein